LLARTDYSPDHVRALIQDYQAFRARVDTDRAGLNFLVQMADLDRVLALIPRGYLEVVLLHGLMGLPQRTVAELLNRGQSTISERYDNALVEITHQLNRRFLS
jgi:DNA-directed RNA polymerase specialized sigma24 family protein